MKVLICKNDYYGGANLLLDRLYNWMKKNKYDVDICIICKGIFPHSLHYDLAILPSYVVNDIYSLKRKGIIVDRVLLWIMGMGSFQDGYYNPANTKGLKGLITRIIAKEAQAALNTVNEHKSICFTDVVGRYNTFKTRESASENYENYNLIPIGIVPNFKATKHVKDDELKCCWVGRVSHDFKYIPLVKSISDLNAYCEKNNIKATYTVAGGGDALNDLKTKNKEFKNIDIKYIEYIDYKDLDSFFSTQDLAFVMGTSSLDAAKNKCPSVVITPVRGGIDKENVFYRWIYESKGYSLGEYPGLDLITNQVMSDFDTIMNSYNSDDDISLKCWNYTLQFDENVAFKKLLDMCDPKEIDRKFWLHIKRFYYLKYFINLYINARNKEAKYDNG